MKRIIEFVKAAMNDYGRWLMRFPAWFCMAMFGLFWLYRSSVFSGDGDQIVRMVEAGYWMVHSELLSQALFQLIYRILHPFGWDGMSVIQLVSCAAGAVSIGVLLRFNERFVRINPLWALGLFFSSGLALYCNGHTEYYTQFLVFLFLYGYMGVAYLRGETSALRVALVYSFSAWIHLGILFALPSLLILPVIKQKNWRDYQHIAVGLIPLAAIYLFKKLSYMLGIHIHGLSPHTNFVPFTPDPANPEWYTFLSLWHVMDWVYGWSMRSWIFWFVVLLGTALAGWRSLLKPERLFLLIYTLCYTGFTIVWHPNLGIHQDWDLFAFEAAPCLLLVLTYMPEIVKSQYCRMVVAIPVLASMIIMGGMIIDEAQFHRRGHGRVIMQMDAFPKNMTFNGHNQYELTKNFRYGNYSVKIIQNEGKKDFFVHTAPGSEITIPVETIPFTPVDSILNQ